MNILIILAALLPAVVTAVCPEHHFWSDDLSHCVKCDKCETNQIKIKDCQQYANTECATVPDVHVDKTWLKKKYDIFDLSEDELNDDSDGESDENELNVDNEKHHPHHLLKLHDEAASDDNDDIFQDYLATHENKMKAKKKKNHQKNKKHYTFKQRANDKMMNWDEQDRRLRLKERQFRKSYDVKHPTHFHFVADADDNTDFDVFGWGKGEMKHQKNKFGKHKNVKNDDEVQLEELLVESRKQLKRRKDDLLKNMKEDEEEEEEEEEEESMNEELEGKKPKLNYPLYNDLNDEEAALLPKQKTKKKPATGLKDNIFKDLIKSDESKELELEALMSNKKDSLNYREVEPKHRMFLGEPSTISEIIGQVKDPEEVLKEEMGKNVLYSRAKFNVLPLTSKEDEVSAVPFSAAERFVWDWQNVAMASAVAACSVFFLVVTVYCLVCSGHWNRRPKSTSYTDDMEEMTTRVALMQPTIELSINDGLTTGKYLEQVLGQKR